MSDPDVAMDTSHLERALRVIPMGRRNGLFSCTGIGAEQVGIIQSLLVTCKLHSVNPHEYLVDVLQRISTHPASQVEELTPREWKKRFSEFRRMPESRYPAKRYHGRWRRDTTEVMRP